MHSKGVLHFLRGRKCFFFYLTTSGYSWKISCGIWKHITELFILCYIKIHWSFQHCKWIFYPWVILNIMHSFGKYYFSELYRSSNVDIFLLFNIKISHLLLSLLHVSEVFRYLETARLIMVVDIHFPKFTWNL